MLIGAKEPLARGRVLFRGCFSIREGAAEIVGRRGAFGLVVLEKKESGGVFDCQGRWCRLARGEIFFGAKKRFLEEL